MGITDESVRIHNTVQRHATQLEEVDLLLVSQCDPVIRVRQANEGDPFITPVLLKGRRRVGSYCQDLNTATGEFFIFIPQARQLRATVRSLKATQEGQYDRPAPEVSQANRVPLNIRQLKIGRGIPRCDQLLHT